MGLPVDQLIVLEGIPASKQAEGSYMKHNIIIKVNYAASIMYYISNAR